MSLNTLCNCHICGDDTHYDCDWCGRHICEDCVVKYSLFIVGSDEIVCTDCYGVYRGLKKEINKLKRQNKKQQIISRFDLMDLDK
jgi:hypothetical protein